jgi:hypothetical protein
MSADRISSSCRGVAAVLTMIVLAGCGPGSDAPTGTGDDSRRLSLAVVAGAGQRGFPGDQLAEAVIVQLVDELRRPVEETRLLHFTVEQDAGTLSDTTVLTSVEGRAAVRWRLGDAIGSRRLRASIAGETWEEPLQMYAEIVSPALADLVVVRGLASGSARLIVREEDATALHVLSWPDTVLRLLPLAPKPDGPAGLPSWQEVTAFTDVHRPATVLQPWTAGVDTVRLDMRPPVQVPFAIWITHSFEETAARARHDLRNLDQVWSTERTGLRVGTVRVEDATSRDGKIRQCSDDLLPIDPDVINVYYVNTQVESGRPAYACGPATVLMGMNTIWSYSPEHRTLLAHEVGHVMSLVHVDDDTNVMSGSPVLGGRFTPGQVYRMHFDAWGTLNSILRLNTSVARNCYSWLSRCPAATFQPW